MGPAWQGSTSKRAIAPPPSWPPAPAGARVPCGLQPGPGCGLQPGPGWGRAHAMLLDGFFFFFFPPGSLPRAGGPAAWEIAEEVGLSPGWPGAQRPLPCPALPCPALPW